MKKILLIILAVFTLSGLFGHEVTFSYAIKGTDKGTEKDVNGWLLNFINLSWGDTEFTDYALSITFQETGIDYKKISFDKAWYRFQLHKELKVILGKQGYLFGNVGKGGPC